MRQWLRNLRPVWHRRPARTGRPRAALAFERLEDRTVLDFGISEFGLVTGAALPVAVAPGPDGAVWFTEAGTGKIGRVTTAGQVTEFSLPAGTASDSEGIARGPDGNLWFTEFGTDRIGRITPTGAITEF